jgi:hypothetical protein
LTRHAAFLTQDGPDWESRYACAPRAYRTLRRAVAGSRFCRAPFQEIRRQRIV